jgi:hypothetical protein
MLKTDDIKTRFEKVFPRKQAVVLTDVFIEFQDSLVKSGDFNKVKWDGSIYFARKNGVLKYQFLIFMDAGLNRFFLY